MNQKLKPAASAPATAAKRGTLRRIPSAIEQMTKAVQARPTAPVVNKKPAKTKPAPVEKQGNKSVKPMAVAFIARSPVRNVVHVIADAARPAQGSMLFAHTHAALSLLGMLNENRPAIPKRAVLTFLGQRAVTNHLKEGNFEHAPDHKIALSEMGRDHFLGRVNRGMINGAVANAFTDLFIDGKVAPITGVKAGEVYQTSL